MSLHHQRSRHAGGVVHLVTRDESPPGLQLRIGLWSPPARAQAHAGPQPATPVNTSRVGPRHGSDVGSPPRAPARTAPLAVVARALTPSGGSLRRAHANLRGMSQTIGGSLAQAGRRIGPCFMDRWTVSSPDLWRWADAYTCVKSAIFYLSLCCGPDTPTYLLRASCRSCSGPFISEIWSRISFHYDYPGFDFFRSR